MGTFSFPSKTFLLGEYSVLKEGKALMLAHAPCFTAHVADQPTQAPAFHKDSAAGLAAAKLGVDLRRINFTDPHGGKGGFGGSGAEFLAVLAEHENNSGTPAFAWQAFNLYRELGSTGSGADILTQAAALPGEVISLDIQNAKLTILSARLGLHVTLFHTGHKLPTHQHLQNAGKLDTAGLAETVNQGVEAFSTASRELFVTAVKGYSAELQRLHLVAPHTQAALQGLAGIPEVLAAKGCGALGSDVILVCTLKKPLALADWAKAHSLVEVASLPI